MSSLYFAHVIINLRNKICVICTMEFIDAAIQEYAENHSSSEAEVLYKLNRYTHSNVLRPRMLSGHLQGRFLSMISKLVQAEFILDIGTYTGYSALCLAEGLKPGGILYTIDNNEETMAIAERFIKEAGFEDRIITMTGDAIAEISILNDKVPFWDIVWMDADKSDYMRYYELCIDKLKPGGLLMADNVLWSGKVLDEKEKMKDRDTATLHAFNQMVNADPRVECLLLPIRDGIMMIRKK